MAYGVIIPLKIAAENIQSLNRSAVSAVAQEQGMVGYFSALSTTGGQEEVWTMTAPVTAHLFDLWMVYESELVLTADKYRNLDPDPRNFIIPIGTVYSVFKPQIGDLIRMTEDAVTGTKSTNEYVVATNAATQLTWAAAAVSGLSLHLVRTTYIAIGSGSIGSDRVTAYDFEVTALA